MTCVVGLVHRRRVFVGVDSAAVAGWTRRVTRLSKVFRRGPFLLGYTTSFRMGQLLEHHLELPEHPRGASEMSYMVRHFVEAVRKLLKERGFAKIESNTESGGQFLVAYRGRLFTVESDFQVGESGDGFDAIGTGGEVALGAMKALERLAPAARVRRALGIAAHFNMGVCPPFVVKSIAHSA
jgi:ATP-dependent protease HslVU (ClpYQ) peptidase subunit